MKRILVTGAAGFIGSHLTEQLLKRGNQVVGIDNFITGNRNNLKQIETHPDFLLIEADLSLGIPPELTGSFSDIYHLASPASPKGYQQNPILTHQVNAFVTHELAKFALVQNAVLFFASTSEVYGDPLEHPQKESYWGNVNIRGIRACYDESKRFGEMVQTVWAREKGLQIRTVRIFNTYGPRMDAEDGRIIPTFVNQAMQHIPITIYGNGKQTRSFCYVDDLVKGIISVMEEPRANAKVYNLGNPEEHTILEMAEMIKSLTRSSSLVEYRPKPEDDPTRRKPDISAITKDTGWEPTTSLEDGLKKTIEYFRKT